MWMREEETETETVQERERETEEHTNIGFSQYLYSVCVNVFV